MCVYVGRSGAAVTTVAAVAIPDAETAQAAGDTYALVNSAVLSDISFRTFTAKILRADEVEGLDFVLREISRAQTTIAYLRIIVMTVSIVGESSNPLLSCAVVPTELMFVCGYTNNVWNGDSWNETSVLCGWIPDEIQLGESEDCTQRGHTTLHREKGMYCC